MARVALITGATGFIGGRLAQRLLDRGWRVHALVRVSSDAGDLAPSIERHVHDGGVAGLVALMEQTRPGIVFHLASLYVADHKPAQVDALIESNVLLPAQLAEAMTLTGVSRLVNTGTASQHFGTSDYNPVSLYAATKQACADVLHYYHEARGLSVVTLKLFDTYGVGDRRRKLIQLLVDAAMSGEPLGLSPGDQLVDLLHVDDVIDAFVVAGERLLAGERAVNEDYLLGGERLSVRDLVGVVAQVLGRSPRVEYGARPYHAREVMVPVDASCGDRALPGWRATRRLADSLSELVGPATVPEMHRREDHS